ncbi:hypothetical protein HA052_24570 [Chromobacterium haemolyticum]|uniref:Uncharacterized protein n=1 Tax=Chromobacterium fluminis TaxID=3044269 RepID=A0ABX0LIQ4_9NEIS|nr:MULTISPECIES: hypothetical protein [Chromobacterium]NHR08370.1 hypothetical protein [Chromobacterium haemolyticum]
MASQYNHIFRQLVPPDSSDFVGMVAYALYKKQKIEWVEHFQKENDGREPTPEELKQFHCVSNMASQVAAYREQAIALLDEFLDYALSDKVEQLRQNMQQDALVQAVLASEGKVLQGQQNHQSDVLQAIKKPFYKVVWENVAAGIVASLVTLAGTGLIWLAAKGPEKLMREAIQNMTQTQAADASAPLAQSKSAKQ